MSSSYSSVRANFYVPFKMAVTVTGLFVVPFVSAGKYRCIIDWGDGSTQKVTSSTNSGISHNYVSSGTYEISIKGLYTHLDFSVVTSSRTLVSEIRQWGNNFWKRLCFQTCSNMTATYATGDKPILFQVTNMSNMFTNCFNFNGIVEGWDVSAVINMSKMFDNCFIFNRSVEGWDVSGVTDMNLMFRNTAFNQDINSWNPSSCQNMSNMFTSSSFNNGGVALTGPNFGPNMGNVTTISGMFNATSFNQPVGNWDVSGVTSMANLFSNSSFNQDLNSWTPSSCIIMPDMFSGSSFNNGGVAFTGPNFGPNLGNLRNTAFMFNDADSFNQSVGNWDVSGVTIALNMFSNMAIFNQDLNGWSPSSCVNMGGMFQNSLSFDNGGVAFTGPNFGPSLGNVTTIGSMFSGASSFSQPIGNWDISAVTNMANVLDNTILPISNVNSTINGWATLAGGTGVQSGLTVGMTGLTADSGSSGGRLVLTSAPNNWTFSGLTVI